LVVPRTRNRRPLSALMRLRGRDVSRASAGFLKFARCQRIASGVKRDDIASLLRRLSFGGFGRFIPDFSRSATGYSGYGSAHGQPAAERILLGVQLACKNHGSRRRCTSR
jgi:hypothetical protein